jgi:hypothetical protein
MKLSKLILIFLFLITGPSALVAQSLEAYIFSGYTISDKFPIYGGRAKIHDGHTFGGGLQYMLNQQYAVEVIYHRQQSQITAISSNLSLDVDLPMNVHFILAGSNRVQRIHEKASVYGGVKVGAVIYDPKGIGLDNVTHFAAGVSAGGKVFIQPKLGLRVQANLFIPITDLGGSIFWSPGSGVNVGLAGFGSILHFGFTGGLFYKLF